MRVFKRILPVILITAVTLVISLLLYNSMINREKESCMRQLGSSVMYIKNEMCEKFSDEVVKLHLVETIIIQSGNYDINGIDFHHLGSTEQATEFSRIDIILPDNTIISDNPSIGESRFELLDFDVLANGGERLSNRLTDPYTGEECIFYILPIIENDDAIAVLVGVIECASLSDIFSPVIYDGEASVCLIDTTDGSYIMDTWHSELGNAFNTPEREMLPEYDGINLKAELREQKTGEVAFKSQTTGNALYMYYMPVGIYDWQLAVFAEDTVIFKEFFELRRLFVFAGIVEAIVLIMYFLWNLKTVRQLELSNAEIDRHREQLKILSYTDVLTSMYNRNKYSEVLNELGGKPLNNSGAAYVDLNSLKQINDSQSHTAGDGYICGAAKKILNQFDECSYRIGGDEFVVLAVGIDEDEFQDRISRIRNDLAEVKISASIGSVWQECSGNADELLKKAEQLMYKEKREYYSVIDAEM